MELSKEQLVRLGMTGLLALQKSGILKVMMTSEIPVDLIHLSEASRKYNIAKPTLSRWIKRGVLKIIARDGNKIYLEEASVKILAQMYQQHGGQGSHLFDSGK